VRTRELVIGAAVVLAGLVASACESTVTGSPTATNTVPDTSGETSSDAPPSGSDQSAPPVDNPKDLRGVDPCGLLTSEQQAEFNITGPGQKGMSEWSEADCEWVGSVVAIGLSPNTTLGDGLDRAYRNKNIFDNFAETSIDGYPAVRINFATQSCGLIAGVSDEQTLNMEFTRVSADAPGRGDPCGFAESVMGEVIKNLPDA
jgi:hypothetical protein